MTEPEVKLFEAPDIAALTRNWPRIALRAGVLVTVPVLITLLARSLDLYGIIAGLPLGLDFLRVGPFAYEAKVIALIVVVFLGVAFLVPRRTTQLVIAVCVGGVLWTGHVFITLQWARFFAPDFRFREESIPGPLPWLLAVLLLAVGVVYLLLENLLETRAQQESRKLSADDARALFDASAGALRSMLLAGAGIALALVLAYLGLRALLADARLPFRLNPVFVLFGMGIALAVLVALAARRRSPVEGLVLPAPSPVIAAAAPPTTRAQEAAPPTAPATKRRMTGVEMFLTIGAALAGIVGLIGILQGSPARAFGSLGVLAAAVATPLLILRSKANAARFGPLAVWGGAVALLWLQVVLSPGGGFASFFAFLSALQCVVNVLLSLAALVPRWRSPSTQA